MKTVYIGIHHTGGIQSDDNASTQFQKVHDIDEAHKLRWPQFRSKLGFWVGYTFFIDKTGLLTQTRLIGEETAAIIPHNNDTVSVCLAGNFNIGVDTPTKEQTNTLKSLFIALLTGEGTTALLFDTASTHDFSIDRVFPHRVLHPNHTECYGTSLSDTWCKEIAQLALKEREESKIIPIQVTPMEAPIKKSLLQIFIEIIKKLFKLSTW